jgi:putative ABC transport system substrate-binding protein
MIRRREFITLLGGAAAAWPVAARAQQAVPVIGFLGDESFGPFEDRLRAFREGLSETGYIEGRNVAIEYQWAAGQNDRFPTLAADLVRHEILVISAAGGVPAALAAKAATATIPIVFSIGADPVQVGLVPSLNRPGGNLTGVTSLGAELAAKRLELLHELVPTATIFAALVNSTNPADLETSSRVLQPAAHTLGLELHVLKVGTERDFDALFATVVRLRAGGLVISPDGMFLTRSQQLAALALRHVVPAIQPTPAFAAAGGLMRHRRAHAARRKRSRAEDFRFCVHASACGLGLDRWPQRAD